MELLRYLYAGVERCGYADGADIVEIDWALRDALVLMASGDVDRIAAAAAGRRRRDEVTLMAPVPATGRVFCVGINYLDHQQESRDVFLAEPPAAPVVFLKEQSALTAPDGELELSSLVSERFDWEVELGVLIGAPARAVRPEDAWNVVAGYTVVNDISARDLQLRHVQWALGKNAPASTPVGPGVVPRDVLGTPPEVEVLLTVNGEVKQKADTRDLIFDIPTLIAEISAVTPLLPGDLIATGTPAGVGMKRNPAEFLREGDRVLTTITGIGSLSHTVRTRVGR